MSAFPEGIPPPDAFGAGAVLWLLSTVPRAVQSDSTHCAGVDPAVWLVGALPVSPDEPQPARSSAAAAIATSADS
ncbi:hypothetical protein ACOBQX_18555 [Actinokineospora sp. G85]|uniref:hypothetical protein n=1 Tax=Actinokineospora sp. G85 TaxID=3406626 RepID=UPI003C74EC47